MRAKLFSLLAAALLVTGGTRGQDPTSEGKITEPTKTQPTQPEVKKVTLEDLRQMLVAMGYSPQPVTKKDGKLTGYDFLITVGDLKVSCRVSLSSDQTNIWVDCYLGAFDDKVQPSVEMLLTLLETNNSIWPAYNQYFPSNKSLWIFLPVKNVNVTPATLREAIDQAANNVRTVQTALQKAMQVKAEQEAKQKAQKDSAREKSLR